jgi:hypothetical protein
VSIFGVIYSVRFHMQFFYPIPVIFYYLNFLMLDLTSESQDKSLSKRFALKKEMPILKQFRKIHKHYNQ